MKKREARVVTAAVAAALAGGLACTPEGVPNPSGRNTAAKAAPTARANPTASPSPNPTAGASASPTPNTSQDITSDVDTAWTPAPTETLAPVTQPTVTPTPLGTLGKAISVPDGPRFLAFLQNTVRPYVLCLASLASIDNNDQVGQTYTRGIGQPQGIAADGLQDLWVLSAEPPHVGRWKLDLGSLARGASYSVAASPSAIAAQDGEVWVGSAGGILTRILAQTGATASFAGFGSPTAIALAAGAVWVTSSSGEVFKVNRSTGAQMAKFSTGARPVGVAIDASGAVWTADQGATGATRIATDGATSSIGLGAAPAAVVSDARRIWFGLPGKLAYYKPDGTKEGEVVLETLDFLSDAMRPLDPAALAIDAYGRVWALDRQTGDLLPVWGKRPGE